MDCDPDVFGDTTSRRLVIFHARTLRLPALILALAISACTPEPVPYEPVADLSQLMVRVLGPAADDYWGAVGTIMTLEGTEEIAPRTFAEWEAVRNAAMTVAESGNLLMMPGRAMEDPRWNEMSLRLVATGRKAFSAADARDPDAVFEAGGELYVVCNECHAAFAPDALSSGLRLDE